MKKITIIFMSVLMIFVSCSMDTSYDDVNDTKEKTNTEIVEDESSKEDNSENNAEEPSKEKNDSENNDVVENKTWCDITEDTLILGLNYFVCIGDSQTKLKPSSNVESKAKANAFLVRGYASRYVEIRVKYDNGKLNFSSVNDTYAIVDVTTEGSNINITIEWK